MLNKDVVIIDHRTSEYGSKGTVISDDGDSVLVKVEDQEIRVDSDLVEVLR